MKKIIRLTESELNNIIKEAVNRILQEDGEIGGGGTTISKNGECRVINRIGN